MYGIERKRVVVVENLDEEEELGNSVNRIYPNIKYITQQDMNRHSRVNGTKIMLDKCYSNMETH